jgi:hypothetical protein
MLCFSRVLYLEYRAAVSRLYMPLLINNKKENKHDDYNFFFTLFGGVEHTVLLLVLLHVVAGFCGTFISTSRAVFMTIYK